MKIGKLKAGASTDPSGLLKQAIGHRVLIRHPKPEQIVEIETINHNFAHAFNKGMKNRPPPRAEINGQHTINYLDLFLQLEGEVISDEECAFYDAQMMKTVDGAEGIKGRMDSWREKQERMKINRALRGLKR